MPSLARFRLMFLLVSTALDQCQFLHGIVRTATVLGIALINVLSHKRRENIPASEQLR